MKTTVTPQPGDALLIVDVQNDFLPGGALAVPRGDEVIAPLNQCIAAFTGRGLPVFATRDWHPANHCSFKERGGPWPAHCVQETPGAAFAPGLKLPAGAVIVSKAVSPTHEAYSAFAGTKLDTLLFGAGTKRLFVGGLATDYCVLHTVLDALRARYAVFLLHDAVGAVNLQPRDGPAAEAEMIGLGAVPITLKHLAA
jgi:nicotinamidase/pyrazinamidase